jgi:hypothetical protein
MDRLGSDMRIGQISTEIISPERVVGVIVRTLLTVVILIALLAILRYIARSRGDRRRDRHHDVQAHGRRRLEPVVDRTLRPRDARRAMC